MRFQVALVVPSLLALSCSEGLRGETSEMGCEPRLPRTGKAEIVPDFNNPTSCAAVVLMCHYCHYNADGAFTDSDSKLCGVCFSTSF
jgi:hypothetical protein